MMRNRTGSLMFYSIIILGWAVSWSLGLQESTRSKSAENRNNNVSSNFPSNQSLKDIYDLASSRTVLAEHVFRGSLLSYNERIIPQSIIASFKLKAFYKNRFGQTSHRQRSIWVIDRTYRDTFHCFKFMKKRKDYIVYLNGTALRVSSAGVTRDYYWVSSKPQLATLQRVKQVVEYSCSECPSKPTLRLSHSTKTSDGITNLHLKCWSTSECNLPVRTFWFKDMKLIKGSENNEIVRVNIFREVETSTHQLNVSLTTISPEDTKSNFEKYSIYKSHFNSELIVKDIKGSDNGTYRCLMMNVVGERNKDLTWPLIVTTTTPRTPTTKKPRKVTHKNKLGFSRCDDYACMYRGHCRILEITGEKICSCFEEYYGKSCQFIVQDSPIKVREPKEASQTIYIFITFLTFVLFLLLIAVFCLIRSFERIKEQLSLNETETRMQLVALTSNPSAPKELVHESQQPISDLPQTSAHPNQYIDNEEMISSVHPMLNSDKPASGRSMRRAFTHYFFGPASTPPFKMKSPTFNGKSSVKPFNVTSKPSKSHQFPPLTPKSSSSPSQLSKPPDTSRTQKERKDDVNLELLDLKQAASAKSHIT